MCKTGSISYLISFRLEVSLTMPPTLTKYQKIGLAMTLALSVDTEKPLKRKQRIWMKKYLELRDKINILNLLEPTDRQNYLRMTAEEFEELFCSVAPLIEKKTTILRKSVNAKHRFIVTLRFLATGNTYQDLKFSTFISQPLLSQIIPETCRAIYKSIRHYIKMPESQEEWKEVAKQFELKWNFSHCIGACDGKHIAIEKPRGSASLFYNYKGYFSIILFAVVNANYEFLYINTGSNGSVADSTVLKSSRFYQKLIKHELNLPSPSELPGTDVCVPYVFLGDSAFPLNENFMKPFPFKNISYQERIFNYRLSRARRVVENAFGILASRFRVFRRPLNLDLDNVDAIILACCALHNFLGKKSSNQNFHENIDYETEFNLDDKNIDRMAPVQQRNNINRSDEGTTVRNKFMRFFISEGRVSFQDRMANVPS